MDELLTGYPKGSIHLSSCIVPKSEKNIAHEQFDKYSDGFSACNYQVAIYAISFKAFPNKPFTALDVEYLKWAGPTENMVSEITFTSAREQIKEFLSFTANWDRVEDEEIIFDRFTRFWMIVQNYVQVSSCKIYQYHIHHDHPDRGIFQEASFAFIDSSKRGLFLFMNSFD